MNKLTAIFAIWFFGFLLDVIRWTAIVYVGLAVLKFLGLEP